MREFISLFLILVVMCFCFSSCAIYDKHEDEFAASQSSVSATSSNYIYMNCYATFERINKGDYITYADTEYDEKEEYISKVRWKESNMTAPIMQADQVVEVNGKVTKSISLSIICCETTTWSKYVSYKPIITSKGSAGDKANCYIRLVDKLGTEYHVMLTPVPDYNTPDYIGSAVYIIDHKKNTAFWYDA